MTEPNERDVSTHFAFGENWSDYSKTIDEPKIDEAVDGLSRVCGGSDALKGKSFLDVGCGSGIHALAAARLGVASLVAVDIDADSVSTTRATLAQFPHPDCDVRVEQRSVFDLVGIGAFDVVYSWGVLHHTGAMDDAIRIAAGLVKPGGLFVIALYRKTWLCPLWKVEKRWYSKMSERGQGRVRSAYMARDRIECRLRGIEYDEWIGSPERGMDRIHDAHDWLGGYPYESITPEETVALIEPLGFDLEQSWVTSAKKPLGLFGAGNDEWRFRRR